MLLFQVLVQTPTPPDMAPVIVNSGPSVNETIMIIFSVIAIGLVSYQLLGPLFRAWATRIEGRGGSNPALERKVDELQQQLHESDQLHGRIAELEERLDFAERLLAQRDDAARLPLDRPRS
jgi:Tfp pilus assembly protein PilN